MNWEGYGRRRGILIDSIRQIDLKVSGDKTMNMMLSRHQNAGQDHGIKTANRSLENVVQFNYLVTSGTKQNVIKETRR
jgi:hypothetical protein